MVTVQSGSCHLTVRGHAGSARRGEDLVCAAASALVLALCRTVTELEKQGALEVLELKAQPGDARIVCRPGADGYTQGAFRTAAEGLKLLAELFPGYVRVEG